MPTFNYARPESDVAAGLWTTTPLYQKIDEVAADDADVITSSGNPDGDTCEIKLSNIAGNTVDATTVQFRYRKDPTSANQLDLTVSLWQGSTKIAESVLSSVGTAWTNGTLVLTTAQVNSITDRGDLRLQFSGQVQFAAVSADSRSDPLSTAASTAGYVGHTTGTATDHPVNTTENLVSKPQRPMFMAYGKYWLVDYLDTLGWYVTKYNSTRVGWEIRSPQLAGVASGTQQAGDNRYRMDAYFDGTYLFIVGGHQYQNKLWKLKYTAALDQWNVLTSSDVNGAFVSQDPSGDRASPTNCTITGDTQGRVWLSWCQPGLGPGTTAVNPDPVPADSGWPNGDIGTVWCEARLKSTLALATDASMTSGNWPMKIIDVYSDDLISPCQFNDGTASVGLYYTRHSVVITPVNAHVGFRHRHDTDLLNVWQTAEHITDESGDWDDHGTIVPDANGNLYCCWKTSAYAVLTRAAWRNASNGVWTRANAVVGTADTRQCVGVDLGTSKWYVFVSDNGVIKYKSASLQSLTFGSATTVISGASTCNDPEAPRDPVPSSMPLLIVGTQTSGTRARIWAKVRDPLQMVATLLAPATSTVTGGQSYFEVQLAYTGNSVDDATVVTGAVVLKKDGTTLANGTDYTFSYTSGTDVIRLTAASEFLAGSYSVELNTGATKIKGGDESELSQTTLSVQVNAALPTATLLTPATSTVATTQPYFEVQLACTGDTLNDASAVAAAVVLKKDTVTQTLTTHYTFNYNSTTKVIRLTSVGGDFPAATYSIELNTGATTITATDGGVMNSTSISVTISVAATYGTAWMWLDAIDQATRQSAGTAVSTWTDSTPNAANGDSNSTSPVLTASCFGSNPGVRLNGTSQYLRVNSVAQYLLSEYTLVMVASITDNAVTAGMAGAALWSYHPDNTGTGNDWICVQHNTGKVCMRHPSASTTSGTGTPTNYDVIADTTAGANASTYKQGILAFWSTKNTGVSPAQETISAAYNGTDKSTTSSLWAMQAATRFSLGQEWDGTAASDFIKADFGSVVLYRSKLSTANLRQVEGFLAWRYGLQSLLPAGHTWKDSAPSSLP